MADATILFRDALQSVYGLLDWLPEPSGEIQRFRVPDDKPGSLNGWYVLYLDGIASGAFGSWKSGGTSIWCSREPVDAREAAQIRGRVEQARRQREAEQHQRQQKAAERANHWLRNAHRADSAHAYLVAKGVRSNGLRQRGTDLLIPLYLDGRLVNLQRIAPDCWKTLPGYALALSKTTPRPDVWPTASPSLHWREKWPSLTGCCRGNRVAPSPTAVCSMANGSAG